MLQRTQHWLVSSQVKDDLALRISGVCVVNAGAQVVKAELQQATGKQHHGSGTPTAVCNFERYVIA